MQPLVNFLAEISPFITNGGLDDWTDSSTALMAVLINLALGIWASIYILRQIRKGL